VVLAIAIILPGSVYCGSLDKLLGDWMKLEPGKSIASKPRTELSIIEKMKNNIKSMGSTMLHTMGSFLPLRGLASFAADLGIPGAATIMDILTPKTQVQLLHRTRGLSTAFNHRSRHGREKASERRSQRRSANVGYSQYRPEIHSLFGAAHGDRECMLKLACLSGKRLSSMSGASAVAILMSTATNMLPKSVREPYSALKNSVLYSDDCSQYVCATDNSNNSL